MGLRTKLYLLNIFIISLLDFAICQNKIYSQKSRKSVQFDREIQFSGHQWLVKSSKQRFGPGPNRFSDESQNVWVDENDNLHLKIIQKQGRWYCSEVVSKESFGYGKYVFTVNGNFADLDKNVIFGLFTWDDAALQKYHNEIDLEYGNWGVLDSPNLQFVIQPEILEESKRKFKVRFDTTSTINCIEWIPGSVKFTVDEPGNGKMLRKSEWSFDKQSVPIPDEHTKIRMNLWLFAGKAPKSKKETEIIITKFDFFPWVNE